MDGKRFGVGLAAGLFVGLAIVVGSGGVGASPSIFAALTPAQAGSVASTTTAATATSTASSSTTTPPDYSTGGLNGLNSTVTTTSASTTGSQKILFGLVGVSSGLSSISTQPPASNAIIFVPVLVAFLLGAIIYRASNRNKEEPSDGEA
jgi:hypothetical protein